MLGAKAPSIIELPTNRYGSNNECYYVSQEFYSTMVELYPNADVLTELKKMKAWLLTNKNKRKTLGGMEKFINGWLSNAQNKPVSIPNATTGNPFFNLLKEGGF